MNTDQILYEELQSLESDIVQRHVQAGQVASGKTKEAFELNIGGLTGQLLGASYLGVLKGGRKPGKVPKDFIDILKRWVEAKGISFQNEEQFNLWVNAVKWKIMKEGTKLYRSEQTQDIFDTPIEQFNKRISDRIINYYEQELVNDIFNF